MRARFNCQYYSTLLSIVFLFCPMLNAIADNVDLSKMPDRLPDVQAGETIQLDVSKVIAKGGLHSVRWDVKPRLASRKYQLSLIGENRFDKDWRYWFFTAPALYKDTFINFEFTAVAKAKNKQGKRYRSTKTIKILVKAGKGKVTAKVKESSDKNAATFDARGSSSGNGSIAKYIWRQTEGPLLPVENRRLNRLRFM